MADKKSFIIYYDRIKEIDMLNDAERGILFSAIMHYAEDGSEFETDNMALRILFSVIKGDIDRNEDKYEEVCKRRSEAAKNRWNKTKMQNDANDANAYKSMQSNANNADNVNENVNVNENANANENVNVNENEIKPSASPTPSPSLAPSHKQDNTFSPFSKHIMSPEQEASLGRFMRQDSAPDQENTPSPSKAPNEEYDKLVYDYGEDKACDYIQRAIAWQNKNNRRLKDLYGTARKWLVQDGVPLVDHEIDKYNVVVNQF